MRVLIAAISALALLLAVACSQDPAEDTGNDPLLAKVHQRELRLSELEGMFPDAATYEDSVRIIQRFANRWARDAVLQWESERNLPADLNIDRLVRDYRSSLVRSAYEELLVQEKTDSTVTEAELLEYYEASKEQYQLERPIVRCYFIRVPYPTPQEDTLQSLWNNGKVNDKAALADYCRRFADLALLDEAAWYDLGEIADQLPEGTLTAANVNSKREFSQQDGTHRYYFRLFELKPRLEIAPLSYVADQAKRVILHGRRREMLSKTREEIFNRELDLKNIELFIPE